jgi:hypothetical protein
MKDQGEWLKRMGELQQQYWDGWRDMAAQAMGQAGRPSTGGSWQDGLEAWSRLMRGGSVSGFPGFGFGDTGFGRSNVEERLLAHGRQYLELLQGLFKGQGFAASGQGFDPRGWIDEMRKLHDQYGQNVMNAGLGNVPWFGGGDPAQIERMVKTFAGAPLRDMNHELQDWLELPAFGLGREHQERGQALMRAWLDYQAVNARYNDLLMKTTSRTFDLLEGMLAQREEPGRQIESARALYDLWIDAAEQAFAEVAMSADYRNVYGELVNTQMRVRAGLNDAIERIGAQFGLPTRTEVDMLARQVHDMKRELRRASTNAGARPVSSKAESRNEAEPIRPAKSAARTAPTGGKRAAALVADLPVASAAKRKPARSTQKDAAKVKVGGVRDGTPTIRSTARKSAKGN